ncbi:MAG: hypothetical protein Q8P81_00555 [Nanoarchaeota archaeon]|nr:hypothetical protein [Nanoarchaeota archaeon]
MGNQNTLDLIKSLVKEALWKKNAVNEAHHGISNKAGKQELKGANGLNHSLVDVVSLPSKSDTQIEDGAQLVSLFKKDLGFPEGDISLSNGEVGKLANGDPIELNYVNKAAKNMHSLMLAVTKDGKGKFHGYVKFFKELGTMWSVSDFAREAGLELVGGSAAKEAVKIKPSDLIHDENARTVKELRNDVISKISSLVKEGKSDKAILGNVTKLFDALMSNGPSPLLKGAAPQKVVYRDYLGEILAPCAVIYNWNCSGARDESEQVLIKGISKAASYKDFRIKFPQSKNEGLVDSQMVMGDPHDPDILIGLSSKGGAKGADPSLVNLYNLMQKGGISSNMRKKFESVFKIIEIISVNNSVEGPLMIARDVLGIIDDKDYDYVLDLWNKNPRTGGVVNLASMKPEDFHRAVKEKKMAPPSPRLAALYNAQKGEEASPGYKFLAAIAKEVSRKVNETDNFDQGVRAVFSTTSFIQVYTQINVMGEDLQFGPFHVVYPPTLPNGKIYLKADKGYMPSAPVLTKMSYSIKH